MFGANDAYRTYTEYAAALVKAGLEHRFPGDAAARKRAVELLAERHAVEDLVAQPSLISETVEEVRQSSTAPAPRQPD
jgi:hypothetical protein